MKSSFAQALLVAAIAGVASALMSGFVLRSGAPTLLLTMLAPAPLMIAGFGWHPLVAALGGIVAAMIALHAASDIAAMMVCGVIAVPAYVVTGLAFKRFSYLSQRPQRDGKELGGIGVVLVILLGLTGITAAMAVEPNFEALATRLRAALEFSLREMTGVDASLPGPRAAQLSRLFDLFARIMLPISALVTLVTLVISATLSAQVAERAGLLGYPRPDFRRFAVPGGGLILIGLAFLVSTRPGYLGAFGDAVLIGMLFLFMLQGLAVIHVRTLGWAGRGVLLFFIWAVLIVFGLPALVFVLVGLLDHLLAFRRGRL